jgi:hypothetical protein
VELIIIDDGLGLGLLNNYPLPEWFTSKYITIYQSSSPESGVETTRVVLGCLDYFPWTLCLLRPLGTLLNLLVMAQSWSSIETGINLCPFYLIFFIYFENWIFELFFTNSPS